jgi:hypothetical protein
MLCKNNKQHHINHKYSHIRVLRRIQSLYYLTFLIKMRSAAFAIVASLAVLTSASPSARARDSHMQAEKRQIESVTIVFHGTGNDSWGQTFPTDLTTHDIGEYYLCSKQESMLTVQVNPAVVTRISNPGGAICVFSGTEGGSWTVHIGETELENPQPLKSGFCSHL